MIKSIWDLWLSVLCTGIRVKDLEFDSRHRSVLSHCISLFGFEFVEHLTLSTTHVVEKLMLGPN